MKRMFVLLASVLLFLNCAFAERIIAEDFYTSGRRYIDENIIEVTGVLPNTLMIKLSPGEEERVRADVLPEDANDDELLWSLPEGGGKIMIFPEGKECRIRAISEGSERVRIDAPSGAYSLINVIVEKGKTPIKTEKEAEPAVNIEKQEENSFPLSRFLSSAAVMLLLSVMLLRMRKNENKR